MGDLQLSADEFYGMTWGNFQRRSLGWVKNKWLVQREVIAAIYSTGTRKKVTGEDIFPLAPSEPPTPPTKEDREMMRKRHEHRIKHG